MTPRVGLFALILFLAPLGLWALQPPSVGASGSKGASDSSRASTMGRAGALGSSTLGYSGWGPSASLGGRPGGRDGEGLFADESSIPLFLPAEEPAPPASTSSFGDRALVLCWHSFLGDPDIVTDFSQKELAAQLDALAALGYRFIDLADALAGRFEGPLNIVATIDDGHRTVPKAVREVFLPRGIRPALFVYPAVIGNVPQAMDESALRSLSAAGCLVGAHGYHHLYVTEKLFRSEPAEFAKEIYKAKARTEAIVGKPVDIYAYPFGAYSPVTLSEVEKAGYGFGVAVKAGFLFGPGSGEDAYELPRLVVRRDNWDDLLADLGRRAKEVQAAGR